MAKRKRSVSVRRRFNRRRRGGRSRVRRVPRKVQNKVHWFKRTCHFQDITDSVPAGQHFAWTFHIDQLPNYAEFAALYDMFIIKRINIRIEPTADSFDVSNIALKSNKYIRIIHDYDDTAALTTEDQYLERGNLKSYPAFGSVMRITLYPKMAGAVYNGLGTGFTTIRPQWCDFDSASIPHFGIKGFWPYCGTGAFAWRLYATFTFGCKDTK